MSNNLLVCKSNWKTESGSLDNIYYIKPTETSDEEDKRIVSDNAPLTLIKGDCTSSCEVIINFSQATTLKYIHIISGARNVELYVKQTNLAQTNYVTTIRGNRLDPENNDVNRVFVADFVNKTNPRIKYDIVKFKLLSLIDKTKCIVNGIFIGVYENPPINSPLIGTNPSETQRTSSFIQHASQYQSQQQQQQQQQPQQQQQNYNLINTYQVQFMLAGEVKKMEARLITRLDRTCLSIVENFNKKISSMEERLGLMEDAIEEIVNRIVPENNEPTEEAAAAVEEEEKEEKPSNEKDENEEQNEIVEPPPPSFPEQQPLPEVEENQQQESQEEEKQPEEKEEGENEQQQQQQSETQNEESNDENNEAEDEQPIDNDCNIEQTNTESEPQPESKKVEESDEHSQQTTETECSECD